MHYLNKTIICLVILVTSCKTKENHFTTPNKHSEVLDDVLKIEMSNRPLRLLELYEKMHKDSHKEKYDSFLNEYAQVGSLVAPLDSHHVENKDQNLIRNKLIRLSDKAYVSHFFNIPEESSKLIKTSSSKLDFRIALNYILYMDYQNRATSISYNPSN